MRILKLTFICLLCVIFLNGLSLNQVFSDDTKIQTRENDPASQPKVPGFKELVNGIRNAHGKDELTKLRDHTWNLKIDCNEDYALKIYPDNAFTINRIEQNSFKVKLSYPWFLVNSDKQLLSISYKIKLRSELTSYVELKKRNGDKYDKTILTSSQFRIVASPNYAQFVKFEGSKFFFEREIGHETTEIKILLQQFFSKRFLTVSHERLPINGEKQRKVYPGQVKMLMNKAGNMDSIAYSPDGKMFVAANGDLNTETRKYYSTITFWNVQDISNPKKLQVIEELDTYVQEVCFSPDGKTLAAVYGKVTKRKSKELTTAYTSDEWEIFEGEVKLWDIRDLTDIKEIFSHRADGDYQETVVFSPDGKFLATGSDENTIQIWDTSDLSKVKERVTLVGHEGRIASLQFSPDGMILASGSWDDTIKLISFEDLNDIREICTLEGHKGGVYSVDFSHDGSRLLTCAHLQRYGGEIKIWDVKTQKCLKTIETSNVSYRAKFSPDGNKIAVGFGWHKNRVILWDIRDISNPEIISALTDFEENVWDLAFSPDGKTLAIAAWDKTVRLWNIESYDFRLDRVVSELPENKLSKIIYKQDEEIDNFAVSPNGKYLVTEITVDRGEDENELSHFTGEFYIWDIGNIEDVKLYKKLKRENERFVNFKFTPDGNHLAVGIFKLFNEKYKDGTQKYCSGIEILNISDGKSLYQNYVDRQRQTLFEIMPDGRTLVTGTHGEIIIDRSVSTINLIDITDLRNVKTLKTLTINDCAISQLSVSPNGKYLLYVSNIDDHSFGVIDIEDIQKSETVLRQKYEGYYSLCFSPDSKVLVVRKQSSFMHFERFLNLDTTLEFWDIASGSKLSSYKLYTSSINDLRFTKDGKYLVASNSAKRFVFWDVRDVSNAFEIGSIGNNNNWIGDMQFFGDGSKMMISSGDNFIKIWNIDELIHKLPKYSHDK